MNLHDTAAGILSYALQSGLLLVVGLLLPRALRLRHPQTMLVYWRVLLAVVIFLPLAATLWCWTFPPSKKSVAQIVLCDASWLRAIRSHSTRALMYDPISIRKDRLIATLRRAGRLQFHPR